MGSVDLGANALLKALRGMIRPLVRTLIARGVGAPALYRLIKQVYVEVAESEFGIDGAPPTDSRIALLTGVHRRDVRSIRSAEADQDWAEARQKTLLLATVMGRWLAEPDYQHKGAPIALPKTATQGPSFEALVMAINKDVRPRTVLDELLRQGLVKEDDDELLTLATGALVGAGEADDRVVFFAANVGDHMAAASANLEADSDPPFLERAVFYNRLSAQAVSEIEDQARRLSQPVLEQINATARSHQAKDQANGENRRRIRFGVYFYTEEGPKSE